MGRKPTGQPRGRRLGSGTLGLGTQDAHQRLTLRIPQALYDRLTAYADGRHYTRGTPQLAGCMREALEHFLDCPHKRQTLNGTHVLEVITGQTVNGTPEGEDNTGQTVNGAESLDTITRQTSNGTIDVLRACGHPESRWNKKRRMCLDCEAEKRRTKRGKAATVPV